MTLPVRVDRIAKAMPTWVPSLLCLVGGLTSVSTGVVIATGRLQRLRQLRIRRHRALAQLPDGWGTWFARGFADLTGASGVLSALGVLLFWVGLGVWLASVGLRLV